MTRPFTKKLKSDLKRSIMSATKFKIDSITKDIIEVISNEYDDKLIGVVSDKNSKSNPNMYKDEFMERLNKFVFFELDGSTKINMFMPTMDSFDFSGRLKILATILNGVAGTYVEVNESDYLAIFKKKPINQDPIDEYVPPDDRIYLIRYNAIVVKAEKDLNRKLVKYPFSNNPPIDIFMSADNYVDNNLEKWIDDIKETVTTVLATKYKGVIK